MLPHEAGSPLYGVRLQSKETKGEETGNREDGQKNACCRCYSAKPDLTMILAGIRSLLQKMSMQLVVYYNRCPCH